MYVLLYLNLMAISRTYYEKKSTRGTYNWVRNLLESQLDARKTDNEIKKRQFMATITQYGLSIILRLYYKTTVIFREKR